MRHVRSWRIAVATAVVVGATVAMAPSPAQAALPPIGPLILPEVQGNPNPGTDLFAATIALGTGGTVRECGTSPRGILVRCVENVNIQPSGSPTASGTTYAHWVFCRELCTPSLMVHEMVHVAQFEQYGDLFGPMYLAEAAVHGSGCENKWEKPAYQTGGQCL